MGRLEGEKLAAVPPNCSPTSVPVLATSCLELCPWGRCLPVSTWAAPLMGQLQAHPSLCFDSVRLRFDVSDPSSSCHSTGRTPGPAWGSCGAVPPSTDNSEGAGCCSPGIRALCLPGAVSVKLSVVPSLLSVPASATAGFAELLRARPQSCLSCCC